MASILKFVIPPSRAQQRAGPGRVRLRCEVIVFPGVRYERTSDDGGKPTPQPKRGRKKRARSR